MSELIQDLVPDVRDEDGHLYRARVLGEARPDGMWVGWIEFRPHGGGQARRTPPETTQPNLSALRYWASGVEAVYLDGALERAIVGARTRQAG